MGLKDLFSKKKKQEMVEEQPVTGKFPTYEDAIDNEIKSAVRGQEIQFGQYPIKQRGTKELITWQVLAREGSQLLVISKYGIDCQKYHMDNVNITWEKCSLRAWLNKEFLYEAFSEDERTNIPTVTVSADRNPDFNTDPGKATQDRVFLLSIKETNQYFNSDADRECKPTKYAIDNGCFVNSGFCLWRLRSPGCASDQAAVVLTNGFVDPMGFDVNDIECAVRPALWINLES